MMLLRVIALSLVGIWESLTFPIVSRRLQGCCTVVYNGSKQGHRAGRLEQERRENTFWGSGLKTALFFQVRCCTNVIISQ